MVLLLIYGVLIGLLIGLTGAGGGILSVPALMSSQGWGVAQAAPVALLAVTMSTLVGTLQGLSQKIVRYRAALWIAMIAAPMANVGIMLAKWIPQAGLTLVFSLILLVVGYRLMTNKVSDFQHPACIVSPVTGRFIWNYKTAAVLAGIGMITGSLTGLLGVGGGFILVPALRRFTNLDMYQIVATSLMVITLVGGVSISIHVLEGFQYPVMVSSVFVLSCIVGMLLGRKLIDQIPATLVQKLFALTVFAVAIYMMYQAVGSF